MRIASVATAYPPYRYSQAVLSEAVKKVFHDGSENHRAIDRLHPNCGVDYRHLMFPIDSLGTYSGFGESNNAWIKGAMEIGERAIQSALDRAGLAPSDISAIFFTSSTGVAMPTVDARLVNRMKFPANIKRVPIFGLGCVAGAAAIARAADYVRAYPKQYALVLSVELSSLTWKDDDQSLANIIACGLFGDGGAAVVVAGEETTHGHRTTTVKRPCPRVVATKSIMYPDTEHMVGLKFQQGGFKVVLSPEIPELVRKNLRHDVDDFLAENGLTLDQICSFIFHTGGPKVLKAMQKTLELPDGALDPCWNSLREVGNLSSASVLTVMEDYLVNRPGSPGCYGILAAMGPAFCSELILLKW